MDKIDQIKTFAAVARDGGFSAASRSLDQPLATVSRKVSKLEERLGVQLLVRTTRSVRLTVEGANYLERVFPLLSALEEAEASVAQENKELSGELTVTSPVPFGTKILLPILVKFMEANPNIRVNHLFDDRRLNYVKKGIDLGLRVGPLHDTSLKMRKLGTVRVVVCASPDYLCKRGAPVTPDDLVGHRTIAFNPSGELTRWNFQRVGKDEIWANIDPIYNVDSIDANVRFVTAGGGISRFYSYQVADLIAEGRLKVVLEKFELPERTVSFLYPNTTHLPRRTRAFLDFASPLLRKKLSDLLGMVNR
ncbi:MAG: LysR substrate-binding domain-containing protein [Paracoccaceae bacterium]